MNPTDFYHTIVLTTPDDLPIRVFRVMQKHVGWDNVITLDELARQTLGKATETTTRQVRDAIEVLRKNRIPILSQSGKSGRCLASNVQQVQQTIAENEARINNLRAVNDGLRKAHVPPTDHGRAQQLGFLPDATYDAFGNARR